MGVEKFLHSLACWISFFTLTQWWNDSCAVGLVISPHYRVLMLNDRSISLPGNLKENMRCEQLFKFVVLIFPCNEIVYCPIALWRIVWKWLAFRNQSRQVIILVNSLCLVGIYISNPELFDCFKFILGKKLVEKQAV